MLMKEEAEALLLLTSHSIALRGLHGEPWAGNCSVEEEGG